MEDDYLEPAFSPPTTSALEGRASGAVVRASRAGDASSRKSFAASLWERLAPPEKDAFNRKRFIQLVAGMLIACCGGSSFAFGIFSNKIKETANLSQSDMTTITTAGFIFNGFTFPAGILFDLLGPQYVIGSALVLSCSGFALLALIFDGIVPASVYSVSIANALTNMGGGFTDCGSLMTNLFNFPTSSGEVLIIQKTFFGLGATFLSLIFDGFFGASQNYIGYAVFVCLFTFAAYSFGAAVTRLPPYKRTTRDLKRIAASGDPALQEAERVMEEQAFANFHNPRLVDQRRLNLGVTILFGTLIFFSSFSVAITYVDISQGVLTGMTVIACVFLASYSLMALPIRIPRFFDYEFLPDIHAPESLVDRPEDEEDDNGADGHGAANEVREGLLSGDSMDVESRCDANNSMASASHGGEYSVNTSATGSKAADADGDDDDGAGVIYAAGGGSGSTRKTETRRSVAGGAPIAVPEAVAVNAIPSLETGFLKNLTGPLLWCFFVTAFAVTGANAVLLSNFPQIIIAANEGLNDAKANSLAVALAGIGSALGRIFAGYAEIFFQRRNALLRERQLRWAAGHREEDETEPDMRPIYHQWNSSVAMCIPISPAIIVVCCIAFTFLPVSVFPPVLCLFGIGVGSYFGLAALTVKEVFTVEVGKHYNFIFVASMISSVLLNRVMFGEWYDAETKEHTSPHDGVSCEGYACFLRALYVLAGLGCVAMMSSSYIVYGWWQIRKRF